MTVRTTCPYCGVGCGVLAQRSEGAVQIAGDPQHPANFGRLCSKGFALGETLSLEDRLLHPSVHGRRTSWDDALSYVAEGFLSTVRAHGPDSVAFYVSGQLLTEDYYVLNKLMKGFIGSANIDTNSRLCMASAVAGHKRAFGADVVPVCYEDLELADLIVLVGSNTAWCHPVLFQRIVQAKERRPEMRVVVIDPRRTPTCELADLHLPIRPGTDVWLFNGLLSYLRRAGAVDEAFVREHTCESESALRTADETAGDLATIARACRVDESAVEAFYQMFAQTKRVITAFSQGVNQSSSGTDKVNSIINCHLLTGRIGAPGMGPFSITGQPNAMGGREVGGMANMLAAHMEIENPQHRRIVGDFWNAPFLAPHTGLKAVDMFDAIHDGRIKAVWIIATNPIVSLPDANKARVALEQCPLVVVSDCVARTDTTKLAHVLLPAAAWGEKDGTVTNSERRISRQRAFLPKPGSAQPDWWIACEVAKRMGFAAEFTFDSPHAIFAEHARLSATKNDGTRAFNIAGLANLSRDEYDVLTPTQWPVLPQPIVATQRLCTSGQFYFPDRRARFVSTTPSAPANVVSEEYPLILNTGRIRDQWHTMTRTGTSPRLSSHLPEPFVDLHPQDALMFGVQPGQLVRVATRWGSLVTRLRASGEIARGEAFLPIHWASEFSSDARVGALVNPVVDGISGEPEFKHTPARVEPFHVQWHGFVLSRKRIGVSNLTWWALARSESCYRYEIALRQTPADWPQWTRDLLASGTSAAYLDLHDPAAGAYRAASITEGRLEACAFFSQRANLPARAWLSTLFSKEALTASERVALLAGAAANIRADTSPVVCACFNVPRDTIRSCISGNKLTTTRQIGERLKAGTNCGSCLPEIRSLLNETAAAT
jgi:assimilatory nitrate reductase catalytic subunit